MGNAFGGCWRAGSGGGTSEIGANEDGERVVAEELERLRLLVQQGGKLDKQGELLDATRKNRLDVVRFLVEECGADVNSKCMSGWTALTFAAYGGHMDFVRFLVNEGGADVNIQSTNGFSALMGAAYWGHMDVVRFLVSECGADVNTQLKDGSTALMKAAYGRHTDLMRLLMNESAADVNIQDKDGFSALMKAAARDHVHIVQLLLSAGGADVDIQDKDGWTALMKAAYGGHTDVIRLLVNEGGADVNIQDKDGSTALVKAAEEGHMDVVRVLVNESGTDVNIQDNDGSTALMKAAEEGHMDVVRVLVNESAADVNIQDKDGFSALMKAAARDHVQIVRFLVNESSADVNLVNCEAHTAIRIASAYGHNDVVRLLTPSAQPNRRSTALNGHKLLVSDTFRSIEIPPSEVELGEFYEQRNIGGDFRVKWLGADAVAKLFISDASSSTFEQEVRAWQELRHPNVLKLYGVCQAAPSVNFFVCEYASQGSLAEYATAASSSSSSDVKPLTWKFLFEAALGLEYLHERGIIHGDLRCTNLLIGDDGMTKLSNFGSIDVATNSRSVVRSMRWQSPEILTGDPPSRESDVYSLGMCILEAERGKRPWPTNDEMSAQFYKLHWNPDTHARFPYDEFDYFNPCDDGIFLHSNDPYFVRRSRELVWGMCCKDPRERSSLTSIISELGHLSTEGRPDIPQPEAEASRCFEGYKGEGIEERWHKLRECMNESGNTQHGKLFTKLQHICDRLQESEHSERLLDRCYSLVIDFYRTVKMTSEEAWAMQLSSTRATTTSMISFSRRVNALLKALGESVPEETEISRQQHLREQGVAFVSGIVDTVLLLQSLTSMEEQAALLKSLKAEMESVEDKYTDEQLQTMKETYEAIESKLATEGVENAATLTPKWFIPWYELLLDEGDVLGEGGFGSVRRAKWLDSDVVVKQVLLPGSDRTDSSDSLYDSLYAAVDQTTTDPETVAKRAEAQEMFRREADIWFAFSHPHVVRLFGACHIGRPFFVCEYATHGTLDKYVRQHPDDLWSKLHEAALGVQYLHARDVVHGDLKGNNVVVGNDLKAKVTDFGLSLAVDSEATAPISGAWHWVAPECLVGKKGEQTAVKPTFESDVYSLGMCIPGSAASC